MKDEFTITRQGRQHVLFAGLLDEAHARGLVSIHTSPVKIEMDESTGEPLYAFFSATVTMKDGRVFSGFGDATRKNVGGGIRPHLIRMAETRAKARALRDAVNIGATSLEELGEAEPEVEAYPSAPKPVSENKSEVEVEPKQSREHELVLTELQRVYCRIPEETRPDEDAVFKFAQRGYNEANMALKRARSLAGEAGMLPEETPEMPREIPAQEPSGYAHDEQIELIEGLAEKLYGNQSEAMSGTEWLENTKLKHPVAALSKSEAKQLIDTMRQELVSQQRGTLPPGDGKSEVRGVSA